jgi:hypothetical protein
MESPTGHLSKMDSEEDESSRLIGYACFRHKGNQWTTGGSGM